MIIGERKNKVLSFIVGVLNFVLTFIGTVSMSMSLAVLISRVIPMQVVAIAFVGFCIMMLIAAVLIIESNARR